MKHRKSLVTLAIILGISQFAVLSAPQSAPTDPGSVIQTNSVKTALPAGQSQTNAPKMAPVARTQEVPSLPDTGAIYQTTGSVNFRTGPSTSYSVIRKLSAGTKVELISKYSSTWYKVSVNGTVGYLSASYLKAATTSALPTTASVYVTTGSINFRTGPSTAYSVIRKLSAGTSATLLLP